MASGKLTALPAQAALLGEGVEVPVEDGLEDEDGELAALNTPPPTCDGTSDFATLAAAALYALRVLGPLALLSRLDQHRHETRAKDKRRLTRD